MVWLTKIKTLIGVVGIAVAVTLTTGFVVAELLSAGEPVTSVSEAPRPAPVIAAPPTTTPESIQPRSEFLKGVYSLAIPDGWSTQFIEQDWVLIIQEKRDAAVALTILMPDPDEDGNGEIEEVDAAEVANQVEPLLREGLAAWPEAVRPTVTRLEKTAWGNLVVERIRLLGPDPEGDGGGLMEATTIMIASEGGCVFHATTHETDPDNAETRAAMARLRPVIESFRVDKAKLAEVRPLLLEKSMVITRGEPMTVILTTPEPDFVSGDVF